MGLMVLNFIRKNKRVIVVAVVTLFLALAQLLPAPKGPFINELQNAGHAPAYGLMALVLLCLINRHSILSKRPLPVRYLLAGCGAAGIGILFEFLQQFVGREPLLSDFLHDLFGISGLLCFGAVIRGDLLRNRSRSLKAVVLTASLVLTAIPAYPAFHLTAAYLYRNRQFPMLCAFESYLEQPFVCVNDRAAEFRKPGEIWEGNGGKALHVVFTPGRQYPGFTLSECYPDWRGYGALSFSAWLPGSTGRNLTLRINDAKHTQEYADRFNTTFLLHPGLNRIAIDLDKVAHAPENRLMDMGKIQTICVFTINPSDSFEVWFDDFRLEK